MRFPVPRACLAFALLGCSHPAEPEGYDAGPPGEASGSPRSAESASSSAAAWLARHPRDDAGNLIPKSSPPPAVSADMPPKPGREPDWDLDRDDAARDYVRRYALATKRYGTSLACVDIGPSRRLGDRRSVEVKASAGCADAGGAGGVRDVFLVDVAGNRLSVDDPAKRDALARWPDGSDPDAPAGALLNASDMRKWRGPLKDAVFGKQQLVVIRVQMYGRGSYPVITLAGWHGAIVPTATPDELRAFDEDLCRANDGAPLGILAGLDRSHILRIRCPGPPRWETL
jgi:hypothetical protein